jgi:hypothetical protein
VPTRTPSLAGIEALGVAAGRRVQHEQGPAAVPPHLLGGPHQRSAEPATAGSPVDEHLGQVGPVLLVVRLVEHELDGADDADVVLRHEQRALAGRDTGGHAAPERLRLFRRQRVHEADRRAAVDTVDQHVGQRFDLLVVDRFQSPDLHRTVDIRTATAALCDDESMPEVFATERCRDRALQKCGFVEEGRGQSNSGAQAVSSGTRS